MIRGLVKWTLILMGILLLGFIAAALALEWQARSAARAGADELERVQSAVPQQSPLPGETRPTVILLHGAGLNGEVWDPVRRGLDPALRVITLDLPGHGKHRDQLYSLDGAAAAVLAAAQSVAPSPVILAGDSLGGFTAMAAAPLVPRAQLAGIVVAGATGNIGRRESAAMLGQTLLVRAMALPLGEQRLATRALARFGIAGADAAPVLAAGVNFGGIAAAGRALVGIDFPGKLASIEAPVLIINGTLDLNAMAGEPVFLRAAHQGEVLHFENCEHGVSMRRPAEFAAAINAFAKRTLLAGDHR